jgi:hypothetical protein
MVSVVEARPLSPTLYLSYTWSWSSPEFCCFLHLQFCCFLPFLFHHGRSVVVVILLSIHLSVINFMLQLQPLGQSNGGLRFGDLNDE